MGHKDWVTLIRMATFKSLSRCRNFADSLLPILNSKSEWAGNRHVPGGCRIFTANTSPVFRSLNHAEQSWAWKRKWRVGHRSFPSSFYTYKPCKAVHHRARMHASSLPSFLGLELDPKQRYLNRVAVAQRLWRHQHGATNSNFQASGSLRESSPPRGVLSFSSGRRVKSVWKGKKRQSKQVKKPCKPATPYFSHISGLRLLHVVSMLPFAGKGSKSCSMPKWNICVLEPMWRECSNFHSGPSVKCTIGRRVIHATKYCTWRNITWLTPVWPLLWRKMLCRQLSGRSILPPQA